MISRLIMELLKTLLRWYKIIQQAFQRRLQVTMVKPIPAESMPVEPSENVNAFKLCYIDGSMAYFTAKPLSEVWGDDWNDAPYEHNAGAPSGKPEFLILGGKIVRAVVRFKGPFLTPADLNPPNSWFSVQDINQGKTPWLTHSDTGTPIRIMAGTILTEFISLIKSAGGVARAIP